MLNSCQVEWWCVLKFSKFNIVIRHNFSRIKIKYRLDKFGSIRSGSQDLLFNLTRFRWFKVRLRPLFNQYPLLLVGR